MKQDVWSICWRVVYTVLLLGNALGASASEPVYTHIFQDEEQGKISFFDSLYVYVDRDNRYSIQDILRMPELEFRRYTEADELPAPFTAWTKLVLINHGKKARHDYFSVCKDAYLTWIYSVEDGRILDEQCAGVSLTTAEKNIPSNYYYIPVSLDAGEQKTFYIKAFFDKSVGVEHLTHIAVQPGKPLIRRHMNLYIWNAFYVGIMVLFCFTGLFIYAVFREIIFVYFAALLLFFALYFLRLSSMFQAFVTNWFELNDVALGQFFISGLIFSLFVFASGYINLKERMPMYFRAFFLYTLVCIGYIHLVTALGMPVLLRIYSHNAMLFLWVLMCIFPVVSLTVRRVKEARILLVSIGVLCLSSLLFLINLQNINPSNNWKLYGFQFGTIFFAGILFYGLFDKINTIRGQKQQLEELNRLRSRFFANISHEFRTPLTLMLGPLQQLIERSDSPADQNLLQMAHRNAKRQLRLVNQLLDLSRLEAGKMSLHASEEDIVPFLSGMVHAYESLAEKKNMAIRLDCPPGEMKLWFDLEKMEKIFFNLLSNAFKFTPTGGKIHIVLKKKTDRAYISITDTGQGISAENLPHIFDRFFQVDEGRNDMQEGSGIGLPLTKELVELHGGSIEIHSEEGKGTTVELHFPLGSEHLNSEEMVKLNLPGWGESKVDVLSAVESEQATIPVENNSRPHAASILIIEDNDDVRAFTRHRLEDTFNILEARDGVEGIEKAFEHIPDLIICDVMMPRKNGYEVCKILKSDIRTSHVPIILLTAKAAHEEKLEGLETGADDYLTKPFDSRELTVRVENLIQLRQQLRQRFAQSVTLKPSEVVTNPMDQEFLESALHIVESNIDDEHFSIEVLAAALNISRPNLNRKLRALVNQSSNQFIQSVRLQRAADLLRQQAATVAEIAFQTGFGSTAYFVKCFKEQFGETPGSYARKQSPPQA